MEKKNKIALFILAILTIFVIGLCGYSLINNKIFINDANKFRSEYMELNDKMASSGVIYPNTSISENNTIKYITVTDAINMLDEGTGIIYFGFSTCPWCRTLVTPLTDVAEELNEIVYYVDISDIRSTFSLEEGILTKTKDGTEEYYQLLNILDDYLEDYYLTDEEGNHFDTSEKRLYAPTLIALKNGKVLDIHVGTVESQKSGYDKLSTSELNELKDIIKNLIALKNQEEV